MNNVRGKRAGKKKASHPFDAELRGKVGSDHRPSALKRGLPITPSVPGSEIKALEGSAKFFECFDGTETKEDHLIPRQSLTIQQHLRIFDRKVLEMMPIKSRQLDKKLFKETGKVVLREVVDNKTTKYSDKTLLRQGKPFQYPADFKRQTSKTKRIRMDEDTIFRGGEPEEKVSEVEEI